MKKGRSARAFNTHNAIKLSGGTDNGKQTQANSLAPCVKHFFDMSGTTTDANGNTTIQDVVTGAVVEALPSPTEYTVTTSGAAANSVRVQMATSGQQTFVFSALPSSGDFMVMVCGKALTAAGNVSFDMGPAGGLIARSIRAVVGLTAEDSEKTPRYCHLAQRRADIDYIFCATTRGDVLEHYVYDDIYDQTLKAGSVSFAAGVAAARAYIDGTLKVVTMGHGSTRPDINGVDGTASTACGGVATVTNNSNDYYGALVCHFENGTPSEQSIIDAMDFHRSQWPAGNKVIYPGFNSY